ncbi:hypothetical protein ACFYSC_29950 [Streptosporangium sp. NPDC004379]|uniref:hypothetical protein n=1 Tax=Streptosporangium sp. NPDC004379 TaxID=3366189 RepID=UPI0036C2518C
MNVEDLLRETFAEMAQEEPPPSPERFLRTRDVRPHDVRRRRPGPVLAAAAAVAVLAVGSTLAVEGLSSGSGSSGQASSEAPVQKRTPAPRSAASVPPEPGTTDEVAPPPAKVWPDAVHTMPTKLPDGRKMLPELFLDERTLLVRTGRKDVGNRPDEFWAYDLGSGSARRLVDLAPPAGTTHIRSAVSGEGRLAWATVRWKDLRSFVDVWTAPVTGGTPRRIASFPQTMKYGDLDMMEIADGHVVWSRVVKGGVYRVSLSGGKTTMVPRSQGYHLLRWPWAGSGSGRDPQSDFDRIVNLVNGEKQGVVKTGKERISGCGVTWCALTRPAAGGGAEVVARRRDGSGERVIPGGPRGFPALGRFLTFPQYGTLGAGTGDQQSRIVLYDLATGRVADLGFRDRRMDRGRSSHLEDTYLDHTAPGLLDYVLNGRRVVVNLAAIE